MTMMMARQTSHTTVACLKFSLNALKKCVCTYPSSWRTICHRVLCIAVNDAPAVTIGTQHSRVSTLSSIRSNTTAMMRKNPFSLSKSLYSFEGCFLSEAIIILPERCRHSTNGGVCSRSRVSCSPDASVHVSEATGMLLSTPTPSRGSYFSEARVVAPVQVSVSDASPSAS